MIEIDGEFFNDIDHDAEMLRVENILSIWTTAMKEVSQIKIKKNISALEKCFGECFIFTASLAKMGMVEKYPNRWKYSGIIPKRPSGEFVTVNNGKHYLTPGKKPDTIS